MLENRPASVSKTALKQLDVLGVDVRLNTKAKDPVTLPGGKQEVTLSGGEKIVVDLYVPTFGVLPNSSFVPSQYLDPQGFVQVDQYLQVKGAEGVFAIGDVNNSEAPQFWFVEKQSVHIAKNLILSLSGKAPAPYKASATGMLRLTRNKRDHVLTFPYRNRYDGSADWKECWYWPFWQFQAARLPGEIHPKDAVR